MRSSVSSPGMPKTWRTPSASRQRTKTSDAREPVMVLRPWHYLGSAARHAIYPRAQPAQLTPCGRVRTSDATHRPPRRAARAPRDRCGRTGAGRVAARRARRRLRARHRHEPIWRVRVRREGLRPRRDPHPLLLGHRAGQARRHERGPGPAEDGRPGRLSQREQRRGRAQARPEQELRRHARAERRSSRCAAPAAARSAATSRRSSSAGRTAASGCSARAPTPPSTAPTAATSRSARRRSAACRRSTR